MFLPHSCCGLKHHDVDRLFKIAQHNLCGGQNGGSLSSISPLAFLKIAMVLDGSQVESQARLVRMAKPRHSASCRFRGKLAAPQLQAFIFPPIVLSLAGKTAR